MSRQQRLNFLFIIAATLFGCSGPPIEKETDMGRDDILYSDDFEDRARGKVTAPPSQTVYPVEPRKGPWSANSQLGQSQPFAPDDNNRQSILKLDEWGMPEVWTIMLGLEFDENGVDPGSDLLVKAIINAGAGGSTQRIVVDWRNGTALSLPMNAVDIVAEYESAVNIDDVDLRLTVTLGKGFTESTPTVTTQSVTLLAGAVSPLIPVPEFASELAISNITGGYDALVLYELLSLNGASAFSRFTGAEILTLGGSVKLNNRNRFLRVTNNSGVAAQVQPFFLLDL